MNMQPIALFSLLLFACSSCKQSPHGKITLRGFPFNDSGLSVITYRINDRANTMSILYSDQQDQQLTLVTYRQQENKFWYGSRINGELLRIERTDRSGARYQASFAAEQEPVDTAARIRFILQQQPASFPPSSNHRL
jgi:hypothetical protein